jgi:FMN-binding domain
MKRPGWYLIAGAAAGFAGVVGFHGSGAVPPAPLGQPRSGGAGASAAPSAPAAQPGGSGAIRSATGTVEQYGYGELSVAVTVRGSQITDVSVPLLRTAEPYSQQLAQQVIPMLRSEVLAVHGARINSVSGATYTSMAYAQSIQSALDKLHVK